MSASLIETQTDISLKWQVETKGKDIMKYLSASVLGTAMIFLAGCATSSTLTVTNPVGPAPTEHANTAGACSLEVYSARVRAPIDPNKEEFLWNNDFGRNDFLYEPAHTDYTIYTQDGKVFQHVKNARNYEDSQPAVVNLPPGTYRIHTRARDFGWVNVPVVIEPGKLTVVDVQREPNPVEESVDRGDAVVLGGERIIGWRANLAGHP